MRLGAVVNCCDSGVRSPGEISTSLEPGVASTERARLILDFKGSHEDSHEAFLVTATSQHSPPRASSEEAA